MPIQFNPASIPGCHTITYRTRDSHRNFPVREVEVLATEEEIRSLVREGYLVRKNLMPPAEIERLRSALDETVARDDNLETGGGKQFGGIFIRHLLDKHPTFLELLHFAPTLSVARAILGPSLEMRGLTGRVCYPDNPEQQTEWHFHQRVIPDPIPPLFSQPHTLDVLLYLDDIDDLNGPLCVVPGSHLWINQDLPMNDFTDQPDQVVLRLPAGSCVITHGSLWHRALPTHPGCPIRRLLLFGYGPAWIKGSIYGRKPANGLTQQLHQDADEETRELLGVAGYM